MDKNNVIMKHTKSLILLAFVAFVLVSCGTENLKPEPQPPSVPQIILDTDIGSSTDDPDGNFRYQIPGDEAWTQFILNKIRATNR